MVEVGFGVVVEDDEAYMASDGGLDNRRSWKNPTYLSLQALNLTPVSEQVAIGVSERIIRSDLLGWNPISKFVGFDPFVEGSNPIVLF